MSWLRVLHWFGLTNLSDSEVDQYENLQVQREAAALDNIGFYTLCDERARNISVSSPLWRACFVVTSRCNFKCPYCRSLHGSDMEFEFFRRIVRDMSVNHGLKNIRLTGGEPTLHPRLGDMVREARALKVGRIAISTNGSADLDLYTDLVKLGVGDFSISLDSCDPCVGGALTGRFDEAIWKRTIENIKALSRLTYVIVGITIGEKNCQRACEIIEFAHGLGVADMKLSTDSKWNREIPGLDKLSPAVLESHPILRYRVNSFLGGRNVRGLRPQDCHSCPLVMDDIIICGSHHYPCIVQLREGGQPIGSVRDVAAMRDERREWGLAIDTHKDCVCKPYCMDIFADCNNRIKALAGK